MSDRISPGTVVSWKSQSQGYSATKTGTVLEFVPAMSERLLPHIAHITSKSRVMVKPHSWVSSVDRYAVRCVSASGLPVIYAPLASVVEAQNPSAPTEAYDDD